MAAPMKGRIEPQAPFTPDGTDQSRPGMTSAMTRLCHWYSLGAKENSKSATYGTTVDADDLIILKFAIAGERFYVPTKN
ncbi:hypothetical protein CEXT_681811 [Caerostris extrusa]|uniref:Uncharacterized protein n=1 Tax=Caerostris extrusa TaxID=172846 RepID=A0AAV4XJ89_CAEEX|nr:hypothetical protein CEXT_681811 [Caerostris extrusa]